jgi:hypothetical protein
MTILQPGLILDFTRSTSSDVVAYKKDFECLGTNIGRNELKTWQTMSKRRR